MALDRRTSQKKLGDVLVNEGVLSKAQVSEAAKYQRQAEDPLGPHLIRCGFITPWDLAKAVCIHFALPFYDLASFKNKKEVLELFDPPFLHGYGVLPIDKFGKIVTMAVCESLAPGVLQGVVDRTQLSPYMYVAPYDKIRALLDEHAPYEAKPGEGLPEVADAPVASGDEGDWMSIFEEAEKKMQGADEGVEMTEGSSQSEEDEG